MRFDRSHRLVLVQVRRVVLHVRTVVPVVTLVVRVHEIVEIRVVGVQFRPVVRVAVEEAQEVVEAAGRGEVPRREVAQVPFPEEVSGVVVLLQHLKEIMTSSCVRDGGVGEKRGWRGLPHLRHGGLLQPQAAGLGHDVFIVLPAQREGVAPREEAGPRRRAHVGGVVLRQRDALGTQLVEERGDLEGMVE